MIKKFFSVLVVAIVIVACSSSDDGGGNNGGGVDPTFDRQALLTNLADNIIIPAFQDFQTKLNALDVARGNFVNDISQSNLDTLSAAWLDAYKAWQYVQMYTIGPAEPIIGVDDRGFVSFFNIFPVTTSLIENAAETGSYDLSTVDYHPGRGLPALDFLIHGLVSGDASAIDKFTTNQDASGYIDFLTDVTSQMINLTNTIVSGWENTSRDSFVNNTANSINGSLNKIVNDYILYYESGFRKDKFGTPAGNFSIDPLPEKVEAFYKNDVSKELALEAMTAIEDLFNGRAFNGGAAGPSFKTYLEFLDRSDLVTAINTQLSTARSMISSLDNSFYNQVINDNTQMTQAYDAIQACVPLLKTDMAQALNIAIDFNDADGD
ncbi:imelysin family protein [Winogradskyella sp. 3972H.M.0a.05]|uniref:imelysin family protein n=1 Tax=Winogradskyella sp. 3972H.M.0a.05 TaxID=2950277 RepID=UPI003399F30E